MKRLIPLFFIGAITMQLLGCSSVPLNSQAEQASTTQTIATQDQNTQAQVVNPSSLDSAAINAQAQQSNSLKDNSVYFEFDSSTVNEQYRSMIEAQANQVVRTAQKTVIAGNTDNRGGREYNLALGQRRAEAVRQKMLLLGVPANQLEAISFGKEKPRAMGDTEEAWAQNRRADILIK